MKHLLALVLIVLAAPAMAQSRIADWNASRAFALKDGLHRPKSYRQKKTPVLLCAVQRLPQTLSRAFPAERGHGPELEPSPHAPWARF